MTFLERFESICRRRGVAPSRALIEAGLSNSLYTKWKKSPDAVPNLTTLNKVADYLNVSVDELARGEREMQFADLKNFPALHELINLGMNMTQAQQRQLLDFAKFISANGDSK